MDVQCGRRSSNCTGLIPDVHGCDKTALYGVYVDNLPVPKHLSFPTTLPPSEALGQLTSFVISAKAPSMSRLLNAEYACSITLVVSAICSCTTLAMH
jgi:hypothetical protein